MALNTTWNERLVHIRRGTIYFIVLPLLVLFSMSCTSQDNQERRLSKPEYQDKVAASWLGQIVGNIYGLSYEFQFLEEPGPDTFPYGYGHALDRVRVLDGAFSDDDTDIEYISLLQMEKYGPEPTYRNLTEAWKYHIRDRIWAANRVALTLMHHGYWPPATGDSTNNPRWFEIDPQLVNEIWAVTAPGMVNYAVHKTEWSARITNDGFGVEPAMFYAAMYAEAFFESDIDLLIDAGVTALPADAQFAGVIAEMRSLVDQYPDDWQAARKQLRDRYYVRQPYNRYGWEPIDATLNGAAAVLAMLYGRGDIWRTLDLACAIGFDADNQAATLTGLLALAQGSASIPSKLLFPLTDSEWSDPFNNRYVNVTRYDMPDAKISDLIQRLAAQGESVILEKGGWIESKDGKEFYVIPGDADFEAPFELLPPAVTLTDIGAAIDVGVYVAKGGKPAELSLSGALPAGVQFRDGRFSGTPTEVGDFVTMLTMSDGDRSQTVQAVFRIRSTNLAPSADRILHNEETPQLELLRDGEKKEPAFYSKTMDHPFSQWYGYAWTERISVSRLGLYVGFPREEWGWLKNPRVEFFNDSGTWERVDDLVITPKYPSGDSKYLQPGMVDYDFRFPPVKTTAIRIVGMAGGHPVDAAPTYGSAVSELTVHSE